MGSSARNAGMWALLTRVVSVGSLPLSFVKIITFDPNLNYLGVKLDHSLTYKSHMSSAT